MSNLAAPERVATQDGISSPKAEPSDSIFASAILQQSDECQVALFRKQLRQDILTELRSDLNENFVQLQRHIDNTFDQFLMLVQKGKDPEREEAGLEARQEQKISDLEAAVASGLADIRGTKKSLEEMADGLEEGLVEDMTALKVELECLRKQVGEVREENLTLQADIKRAISQNRQEMEDALAHCVGQFHDVSAVQKYIAKNTETEEATKIKFEAQLRRKVWDLEASVISCVGGHRLKTCDVKETQQSIKEDVTQLRRTLRSADENARDFKIVTEHSDTSSTQSPSYTSDEVPSSGETRLQKLEDVPLAPTSPGRPQDNSYITEGKANKTFNVQAEFAMMFASSHQKYAQSGSIEVPARKSPARTQRSTSSPGLHVANLDAMVQTSNSASNEAFGKSPATLRRHISPDEMQEISNSIPSQAIRNSPATFQRSSSPQTGRSISSQVLGNSPTTLQYLVYPQGARVANPDATKKMINHFQSHHERSFPKSQDGWQQNAMRIERKPNQIGKNMSAIGLRRD